jgi:hypothetical protein
VPHTQSRSFGIARGVLDLSPVLLSGPPTIAARGESLPSPPFRLSHSSFPDRANHLNMRTKLPATRDSYAKSNSTSST